MIRIFVLACFVAATSGAQAAPVYYTGYSLNTTTADAQKTVEMPFPLGLGTAAQAQSDFLTAAGLLGTGLGVENFEDNSLQTFQYGDAGVPLSFLDGGNASVATGTVKETNAAVDAWFAEITQTSFFGRYDTTPPDADGRFLESGGGSPNPMSTTPVPLGTLLIEFSAPVRALGFYLTDLFDQGSDTVISINGGAEISLISFFAGLPILNPPATAGEYNNNTGDLVFFGVIHDTYDISSVTIRSTERQVVNDINGRPPLNYNSDVFGIDDFYVLAGRDTPPPVVPEPSTLALAGLALAGIPLRFRRRKAA